MHTEIEAKFLDIDVAAFRQKLTELGATQMQPERAMKRRNFDFPVRKTSPAGCACATKPAK